LELQGLDARCIDLCNVAPQYLVIADSALDRDPQQKPFSGISKMTQAYFPPLDRCLTGEERLISWKTAYRASSDVERAAEEASLEAFITDPESVGLLSNSLDPFQKPSAKTKSEFETKTAPINVSQSSNGDYKLEELKEDALWLAQKLEVAELVALRVVVLEWQQRAEGELVGSSVVGTGGAATLSHSLRGPTIGHGFKASANGHGSLTLESGDETARRDRQLAIFLEECRHILMISADLAAHFALQTQIPRPNSTWVDEVAGKITEAQCSFADADKCDAFCATCIRAIDTMLQRTGDASRWPEPYRADDDKSSMYAFFLAENVTYALRLLLASLHALQRVPSHNTVSLWFKIMGKVKFFQDLRSSPTLPDPTPLQDLVSVISLMILKLSDVMSQLNEAAAQLEDAIQYPQLPSDSYYQNDDCMREVNLTLYRAAQESVTLAAPAMHAWSLITSIIRVSAKHELDLREQLRLTDGSGEDEGVISRRRASRRENKDEISAFERQFHLLQDFEMEQEARDNPSQWFGSVALDRLGGYSVVSQLSTSMTANHRSSNEEKISFVCRDALLELIRSGMLLVDYGSEVLDAALQTLAPDVPDRSTRLDYVLANRFTTDFDIFRPRIFDAALARFPFELTPILKLLTALTAASATESNDALDLVTVLESLQTFTVMVPEHFRSYNLDHEDENINSIVLTESLPLFVSKQALSFYGRNYMGCAALTMGSGELPDSGVLAVPTGIGGIVMKESRPMVLRLDHSYSGLEYLGLLLSTTLPNSELVVASPDAQLDHSTAADIILLINSLLVLCMRRDQTLDEALFVLGRLSNALPNEQDIITIVGEILEVELLAFLDQSIQEGSLDLVVSCAEFFDTLTAVSPERVWSVLASSSLLAVNGGVNALAAVVTGTELGLGRFRFLAACVKMYSSLITDAVSGLIKRKAKISKTVNRFDSPVSFSDSTPERTIGAVLIAYHNVMVDAWQSLPEWRFADPVEKCRISSLVLQTFNTLLTCTHGIESGEQGISALLYAPAKAMLAAFAPIDGSPATARTVQHLFQSALTLSSDRVPQDLRLALIHQMNTACYLLSTLLRSLRLADETGARARSLASILLDTMPILAPLLGSDHSIKRNLCELLGEMAQAINFKDSSPPSLLGKLGAETAKCFLDVVTQLDQPLRDIDTEVTIWNLFSSVVDGKQQSFAIYLLTGSISKSSLGCGKLQGAAEKKSLLSNALQQLCGIATMAPERAIAMLRFVAAAQQIWLRATNEVRAHPEFLRSVLEWVNSMQVPTRVPNIAEEGILANEHQMAAHICDILAINISASVDRGDETVLKMSVSKISFLREHGVTVNAYNRSLHRNLSENFQTKLPTCEVKDFKRTAVCPASYGRKYLYDVDLADQILGHEKAWQWGSGGRSQGFADEFARANVNLSLVASQIALLKSWRMLTTTLSAWMFNDAALQAEMAKTAVKCLDANAEADLQQPGMDGVIKIRTEMAFFIVSELVSLRSSDATMKGLLFSTWRLVGSSPVDYDVATAAEDLQYYRTILQILYLALQPHVYLAPHESRKSRGPSATDETQIDLLDPNVAACLVQIMSQVIAPAFRALCGNLHTSIDRAQPSDFARITALLKAILSVPGVSAIFPQIAEVTASMSLIRGSLSLFSWSDRLAEVMDQDPVYGEVAMKFLLTLSTIRPVAEQIAIDGALVQLSSANLSNYFRKPGGKTPFSEPRRMFAIWSEGFLPLCLNLLDAVGPPIAAEVANFLDSFPEQLQRANTSLENREATRQNPFAGSITLGLASEAHSLCLIALILASDTARGAAEGIDAADVPALTFDHTKVKDDALGVLRMKTSLASRLVPMNAREEEWAADGSGSGEENTLLRKALKELSGLCSCFAT